jgi:hypothetical protein
MSRRRLSFTERRRRALALKSARLDKLETRNTITEPISVFALTSTALRGLAQMGIMAADGGNGDALLLAQATREAREAQLHGVRSAPAPMASAPPDPAPLIQSAPPTGGGGGGQGLPTADLLAPVNRDPSNRLSLLAPSAADSAQNHGISAPWHPAKGPGGGAALPPRGGSGASNPIRDGSRASTVGFAVSGLRGVRLCLGFAVSDLGFAVSDLVFCFRLTIGFRMSRLAACHDDCESNSRAPFTT